MPSASVFLDESGDLGWKFDAPYRKGGSSRYLTIAALIVPHEKKHFPPRLIKKLYSQHEWPCTAEKKWKDMYNNERLNFIKNSKSLLEQHSEIQCTAITVNKEKVQSHIRNDPNKLYNYMIGLILPRKIKHFSRIVLSPDPRSIKIQSGNSLPDYLKLLLWFSEKASTDVMYRPLDSATCKSIQFVDMLAGAIQRYHEDRDNIVDDLRKHIKTHELFF
ncbi:MAG: DUF3800 domain-containing protein [Gammaproteobacteria bacterium]|jgi:hypothetical protein